MNVCFDISNDGLINEGFSNLKKGFGRFFENRSMGFLLLIYFQLGVQNTEILNTFGCLIHMLEGRRVVNNIQMYIVLFVFVSIEEFKQFCVVI